MAYETGSATTPEGLLDAIRVFALAQGWTIDTWEDKLNGKWLALHKGTCFTSLITDSTWTEATGEVQLRGAASFDGGLAFDAQPGQRTDTYWTRVNDLRNGPYVAYHFFVGDTFFHVALETSSGRYTHFGFGILDKAGTYVGGEYVFGTAWYLNNTNYSGQATYGTHGYPFGMNTYGAQVRFEEVDCNLDPARYWAIMAGYPACSASTLTCMCSTYGSYSAAFLNALYANQPNHFSGVSLLVPYTIASGRKLNLVSVLGAPKELRYINIKNLSVGQEIVLGADTWMVFPAKQRGEQIIGNATPFSLWHGIAYKKVI